MEPFRGAACPTKAVLSIREFCGAYGIGRTKVYAEIGAGRLKVARVGHRTLVPVAAAEEWLARHIADTVKG